VIATKRAATECPTNMKNGDVTTTTPYRAVIEKISPLSDGEKEGMLLEKKL
jgi:hypothetical protein